MYTQTHQFEPLLPSDARMEPLLAKAHDLHCELFGRLPAADLLTPDKEPLKPGALRQQDVQVGQHIAPAQAKCYQNYSK